MPKEISDYHYTFDNGHHADARLRTIKFGKEGRFKRVECTCRRGCTSCPAWNVIIDRIGKQLDTEYGRGMWMWFSEPLTLEPTVQTVCGEQGHEIPELGSDANRLLEELRSIQHIELINTKDRKTRLCTLLEVAKTIDNTDIRSQVKIAYIEESFINAISTATRKLEAKKKTDESQNETIDEPQNDLYKTCASGFDLLLSHRESSRGTHLKDVSIALLDRLADKLEARASSLSTENQRNRWWLEFDALILRAVLREPDKPSSSNGRVNSDLKRSEQKAGFLLEIFDGLLAEISLEAFKLLTIAHLLPYYHAHMLSSSDRDKLISRIIRRCVSMDILSSTSDLSSASFMFPLARVSWTLGVEHTEACRRLKAPNLALVGLNAGAKFNTMAESWTRTIGAGTAKAKEDRDLDIIALDRQASQIMWLSLNSLRQELLRQSATEQTNLLQTPRNGETDAPSDPNLEFGIESSDLSQITRRASPSPLDTGAAEASVEPSSVEYMTNYSMNQAEAHDNSPLVLNTRFRKTSAKRPAESEESDPDPKRPNPGLIELECTEDTSANDHTSAEGFGQDLMSNSLEFRNPFHGDSAYNSQESASSDEMWQHAQDAQVALRMARTPLPKERQCTIDSLEQYAKNFDLTEFLEGPFLNAVI